MLLNFFPTARIKSDIPNPLPAFLQQQDLFLKQKHSAA
jgi:hypothetical protein